MKKKICIRFTEFRNGVKNLLRFVFVIAFVLINLPLVKPGFSQAIVEYHIFSKDDPIKGAISITFPDGWSTYWKFPGPNGFTPDIKVLKKENLKSFNISWPYPKKLGPKKFTYLGYDGDLLLPVELKKFDQSKNIYLDLDISFGICKSVCVIQNKTLKIRSMSDIDYVVLDKLLKSKNRITMTTNFGSSNKCILRKVTDNEYQITLANDLMRNSELVNGALLDYMGSSLIIETQSFYPEFGRVEALLKLEQSSKNKIDLGNFSILYLDNGTAKRTVGCPT